MTIFPNSATDLALRAFEARPSRAEALADLARVARDRGMNESASMFARRGLAVPPTDDLLFVETWARENMANDLAICGYYSQDPETRELAHRTAEALALDRSASPGAREQARQTLFWYAPKLCSLAPSWRAKQIEGFTAPKGWRAMNPSVCRFGDRLMAVIRCVNYWIEPDGSYKFPDSEPAVITRSFLVEMDPVRPHIVKSVVKEAVADLGTMWWGDVRGMEDLRLFTAGGELWFSCACRQMNAQGVCEQLIGRFDAEGNVQDLLPMRLNTGRYEKNWMPFIDVDAPKFVYRIDPTIIVVPDMNSLPEGESTAVAADNFAGSSQLIRFDGGWLAMEHEPLASPINGRRLNQQRFVWFTEELKLAAVSRRFIFELNEEIEYVMGLVDAQDELIISYGSHDRQAWVGTLLANDVRRMLGKEVRDTAETVATWRDIDAIVPSVEADHDRIALDRTASPEAREASRVELHKSIPFVQDLFPSWNPRRLAFRTPEGFVPHAPSVFNHKGRMLAAVRCMNYSPGAASEYYRISDGAMMSHDVVPVSRTFMLEIGLDGARDRVLGELRMPSYLAETRPGARSYGFEDTRLFEWGGDLWGIAAFHERSADNLPEQWVFRINLDNLQISDARHVPLQGRPRHAEKNWVPILDCGHEPQFLYASDPSTVVDAWGHVVSERVPEIAVEHFHGGSQLVPFEGGWLGVVRWQQILDPTNRWINYEYRNRFAWYDHHLCLRRVSPSWQFPIEDSIPSFPRRMQIVQGLAWHSDGKLVVGYEWGDSGNSFVAEVDAAEVETALASYPKVRDDDEWTLGQINRALQDSGAVERATTALRAADLPEHKGPYKNWDTWLAIWHAHRACTPEDPILDAGGHTDSAFLPGMARLGYRNLMNLNIDEPNPRDDGDVRWRRGDITATGLSDHSQRFVLCQSVLEDLADWRGFFDEMARIIDQGGSLLVSTDYWEVPITTTMKIFTSKEVCEMIAYAERLGLRPASEVDCSCHEAVVSWSGLRYTFFNLLLYRS